MGSLVVQHRVTGGALYIQSFAGHYGFTGSRSGYAVVHPVIFFV
jgi:hypothetical protein